MRRVPTANHGPRRDVDRPTLVVLHYTAMQGGPAPVVALFSRPDTQLSAHYVLGEDGDVVAMVPEDRRAWHAGAGRWGGCADVNSASVGIEICNDGRAPFPAAQMDALEVLLDRILRRHGIPPEGVIGHSDCAPGRKIDPGRRFDWRRLARGGLAVWPTEIDMARPCVDGFRDALRSFGYAAPVDDEARLAAFRLRFRPGHAGPLDARDMGLALALARGWPVDGSRAGA